MDRARWIAVACIALGTGLVSVALGCLFIFTMRYDRAALKLKLTGDSLDDSALDVLWLEMVVGFEVEVAMIAGTLGSALIAGSLLFALFQLPRLRRPPLPRTDPAAFASTEPT